MSHVKLSRNGSQASSMRTNRTSSSTASDKNKTEYSVAFKPKFKHKPRNPVAGYIVRNKSNILPSETSSRSITKRGQQKKWPWQERSTKSKVLNHDQKENLPPPKLPRWPWAKRAKESHEILKFGLSKEDTPPSVKPTKSRWPWQEYANNSRIFANKNDTADHEIDRNSSIIKTGRNRNQQLSTVPFFLTPEESEELINKTIEAHKARKVWPWTERARKSRIFDAPDNVKIKQLKYPWDQRRSQFIIKVDNSVSVSSWTSRYSTDYPKPNIRLIKVPAAGKPSYGVADLDYPSFVECEEKSQSSVAPTPTHPLHPQSYSDHNNDNEPEEIREPSSHIQENVHFHQPEQEDMGIVDAAGLDLMNNNFGALSLSENYEKREVKKGAGVEISEVLDGPEK